MRPLRAGRARPADHPAPRRAPRRRRGLPRGAPRRAGHGARHCRRTRLATPRGARSLRASDDPATASGPLPHGQRELGFAAFETERYKLVVDEDAVEPCQLFDLFEDAAKTTISCPIRRQHPSSRSSWRPTSVRSSNAAGRPIPSIFTGGYDDEQPALAQPQRVRRQHLVNVQAVAARHLVAEPQAPESIAVTRGPAVTHEDKSSKIDISLREICGSPAP